VVRLTLNEPIAGGAKRIRTLLSDGRPRPFEHLDDHGCWSPGWSREAVSEHRVVEKKCLPLFSGLNDIGCWNCIECDTVASARIEKRDRDGGAMLSDLLLLRCVVLREEKEGSPHLPLPSFMSSSNQGS